MFYTNNELRQKLNMEPSIFIIKDDYDQYDGKLQIPSGRNEFPNSPIFPHNTNR